MANILDEAKLREILRDFFESTVGLGKNDIFDMSKDIAQINALAAEAVEKMERKFFKVYANNAIELLDTLTPARPEDLSLSQWHGLVEAIVAGRLAIAEELATFEVAEVSKQTEVPGENQTLARTSSSPLLKQKEEL